MADESMQATEVGVVTRLELASTRASKHARPRDLESGEPTMPERVGRYVVVRRLGAGAMGVVVVAYDPELDRKLAIKLIHPEVAKRGDARTRMLREAKGLARLSHPNVVQVYDAGTVDGQVFIAMELVDGEPLSAWCRSDERSVDEILAVFLAAGRGLAAAHDAGLVHRDFKPDNVLVDREGRARVLDFGLVRAAGDGERSDAPASAGEVDEALLESVGFDETHESVPVERSGAREPSGPPGLSTASELEVELTHGGQVMGTPAYMSPEQWRGIKADARSDQFSFCVALWEALYGERPFPGKSVHELAVAVVLARVTEPASALRLPRRVRRALERGLAGDPDQRFPSMQELLRELGRDEWSGRSLPLAAVALAAFVLLAWGRYSGVEAPAPPSCEAASEAVREAWSDDRRAAMREAFALAAGSEQVRARVEHGLDDYAGRWAAAAEDNCAATKIRHQQSDELLELRSRCLDTKLLEFEALVEILVRADEPTVEQSVGALESLPSLRACEPARVRESGPAVPDDPALAERVTAARQALAGARASLDTQRFDEAVERLEPLEHEVETLDYPPLTAAYAVERGRLDARLDRYDEAAAALQRAFFLATQQRDRELALRAAIWLAELEGAQRSRPEFAQLWLDHGHALLDPRIHPEHAADLADLSSWSAYQRGDLELARAEAQRGLAVLEQAGIDAPMRRISLLMDLGAAEYEAGALAEAEATFRAVLALVEATVGRDNASASGPLNNLAFTYMAEGELERAREVLEESVALREATLGPTNATVGRGLSNLADVEIDLGAGEAALAAAQRAYQILGDTLGSDQFATIVARQRLGLALALVGHLEDARAELRATLELALASPEPDLELVVEMHGELAALASAAGDARSVARELEAVAAGEAEHWKALVSAGRFAVTLGADEVAEVLLTRAIELAVGSDANSRRRLARAKLTLAELVIDRDPERVLALLSGELEDELRAAPKLAAQLDRLRAAARHAQGGTTP